MLKGITSVSIEGRIYIIDERSKERIEMVDNADNQQAIKLKMYDLVQLALTNRGLKNLRKKNNNKSIFATFANYYT